MQGADGGSPLLQRAGGIGDLGVVAGDRDVAVGDASVAGKGDAVCARRDAKGAAVVGGEADGAQRVVANPIVAVRVALRVRRAVHDVRDAHAHLSADGQSGGDGLRGLALGEDGLRRGAQATRKDDMVAADGGRAARGAKRVRHLRGRTAGRAPRLGAEADGDGHPAVPRTPME